MSRKNVALDQTEIRKKPEVFMNSFGRWEVAREDSRPSLPVRAGLTISRSGSQRTTRNFQERQH